MKAVRKTYLKDMQGYLETLRRAELDLVKPYFKPGLRVLELGGGSGYQASVISSWGCEVLSIDIPQRSASQKYYYPVQDYDGQNIPFDSIDFDIVFSSNVLEHIPALPPILAEIGRVLKPRGFAIHILPSSAWRFWASIAHYIYILKRLLGQQHSIPGMATTPSVQEKLEQNGLAYVIKRILLAGSHGEYPSAFSELYYFSKYRWFKVFQENGFDVVSVSGNKLLYSGYGLFPTLPLYKRRAMANLMGSACHIFITKSATVPESFNEK